ncbi:MAG: hypothetical protein HZC51_05230 [Nitrospirae bacterium]|nr:hypothetical protein [Nitrospirota bacterium]
MVRLLDKNTIPFFMKMSVGVMLLLLSGCFPFPARTTMPLRTTVVDAESGAPIEGAKVLRIVCDLHDFDCSHAVIDRGHTDQDGYIKMSGKRKWGIWIPAPGGMPVPNHQIAIWKPGYQAFVFSQYGKVEDVARHTKRNDLKEAIQEIPAERKETTPDDDDPEKMFLGGTVRLYRLK